MERPKISVLMPVYNAERFVREAVGSILAQTFTDFEFIIVNDGSTDETPEILDEYAKKDSRIRIINQPNCGIVVAHNRGLKEAKGEWIFIMHGDDISLPQRFVVQTEAIKKNPSLVLLGGCCQQINSEGVPLKINKYPTNHDDLVYCLEAFRPFFPHPTACFRRDIVLKLGGYRERFCYAEDFDLWLRLSSVGEMGCSDQIVIQLRKHKDNASEIYSDVQQVRASAALICHFRKKFGLSDPSLGNDKEWQEFTRWVEQKLISNGYLAFNRFVRDLRVAWTSRVNRDFISKSVSLIDMIGSHPQMAMKIIKYRLFISGMFSKLTSESTQIWPK